jgi:hypothetical protein
MSIKSVLVPPFCVKSLIEVAQYSLDFILSRFTVCRVSTILTPSSTFPRAVTFLSYASLIHDERDTRRQSLLHLILYQKYDAPGNRPCFSKHTGQCVHCTSPKWQWQNTLAITYVQVNPGRSGAQQTLRALRLRDKCLICLRRPLDHS